MGRDDVTVGGLLNKTLSAALAAGLMFSAARGVEAQDEPPVEGVLISTTEMKTYMATLKFYRAQLFEEAREQALIHDRLSGEDRLVPPPSEYPPPPPPPPSMDVVWKRQPAQKAFFVEMAGLTADNVRRARHLYREIDKLTGPGSCLTKRKTKDRASFIVAPGCVDENELQTGVTQVRLDVDAFQERFDLAAHPELLDGLPTDKPRPKSRLSCDVKRPPVPCAGAMQETARRFNCGEGVVADNWDGRAENRENNAGNGTHARFKRERLSQCRNAPETPAEEPPAE